MSGFPLYWVKNIKIPPLFTTFTPFLPLLLKNQNAVNNFEQAVNCFIPSHKAGTFPFQQAFQRIGAGARSCIFWTGNIRDINNLLSLTTPLLWNKQNLSTSKKF
jgi:hypothetical protein